MADKTVFNISPYYDDYDEDKNFLLVNGSVPGKKGNIVQVRPAVKLLNADEKNTTSTKIIERNNKEEVLEEE